MTILDELAALARERHHRARESEPDVSGRCAASRTSPVEWCLGCTRGLHKYTRVPLPGAEDFEVPVAEVVAVEVAPVEITPADATPAAVEVETLENR